MPSHGNKKVGRSRGRAAVTTALSLSQSWDLQLAKSKDSCRIVDRVVLSSFTNSGATTNGPVFVVSPQVAGATSGAPPIQGTLGNRPFQLSTVFLRYRINKLLLCWRPVVGTNTSGAFAIGFIDDPDFTSSGGTSNPSVGYLALDECRCSHADSVYNSQEVEWKPIDSSAWYYTTPDPVSLPSVADIRLQYACGVAGASIFSNANSGTTLGVLQLYYDITFEGAVDSSTSAA
jgi:hypothetical protein